MTTRTTTPRVNTSTYLRYLVPLLPLATVTAAPSPSSDRDEQRVVIDGADGQYTVLATSEQSDFAQTVTIEVFLTRVPGATDTADLNDALPMPHGLFAQTSDYGARLRINYREMAAATAGMITRFERASPSLSALAT